MQFILRNNLNLMALLGAGVAVYLAFFWPDMLVMQRTVGLLFVALVLHVWEEMRYPGGFPEMMMSRLNFAIPNRHAAKAIVDGYVLYLVFVPLFFPHVIWLAMASMLLGVLEAVAHTAEIKLFRLKHPYSPRLGHGDCSPVAHRDLRHHVRRAARRDAAEAVGLLASLYGHRVCDRTGHGRPHERIEVHRVP